MNNQVDKCVERTIDSIIDLFPNSVNYAITNGSLITTVKTTEGHQYHILDFSQQMSYDPKEYARMSLNAFNDLQCSYWLL